MNPNPFNLLNFVFVVDRKILEHFPISHSNYKSLQLCKQQDKEEEEEWMNLWSMFLVRYTLFMTDDEQSAAIMYQGVEQGIVKDQINQSPHRRRKKELFLAHQDILIIKKKEK